MPHLPHRLAARPLFVMAALALIAGGCGSDSDSDVIGGGGFPTNTPTPTPLPMAPLTPIPVLKPVIPAGAILTPIPALTPVIPAAGGTYKVAVTFVLVEGACGACERVGNASRWIPTHRSARHPGLACLTLHRPANSLKASVTRPIRSASLRP